MGRIWDNHGGKKWFFSTGPTIGIDATAGFQQRNIYSKSDFNVGMYDGYSSSVDIGVLCFDWCMTGGDNVKDAYQSPFGDDYSENGWGMSVGSPLGGMWSMDITNIFGR